MESGVQPGINLQPMSVTVTFIGYELIFQGQEEEYLVKISAFTYDDVFPRRTLIFIVKY